MRSKDDLEKWYSRGDPWRFNNTVPDKIRRKILLKQIEVVFSDGSRKTVLDAGCGEGHITRGVATTYDAEIDAFDISDKALVMVRAKNAQDRISYFQLNLNDYVPDRKYDLIMCEETLYYLTDDERTSAVRMFHRAIKGGVFQDHLHHHWRSSSQKVLHD